jgi:CheY-specific phosphatase CheX
VNPILYVSADHDSFEMFRRAVTAAGRAVWISPSKVGDIGAYLLVVYRWESGASDCTEKILSLQAQCRDKSIPFAISVEADAAATIPADFLDGATILLSRPYHDQRTISQLSLEAHSPRWNEERQTALTTALEMAVTDVFSAAGEITVRSCGDVLSHNQAAPEDVVGAIELRGDFEARAVMTFPPRLSRRLSAALAGCDCADLGPGDDRDGICEIVNQICGRARIILQDEGFRLQMTLPQLIDSAEVNDQLAADQLGARRVFESEGERCSLYVRVGSGVPNPLTA